MTRFKAFRNHLRETLRGEAEIGLDNSTAGHCLVGVGGVDNLSLLVVDDSESGEAIAGAELAAPAGGDGVHAAVGGAAVCLSSVGLVDNMGAAGDLVNLVVDAEGPGARGVGLVADTLHVLNCPLGAGSHHGLGWGRSGESGRGRENGSDDGVGELHDGGV